MQGRMKSLKFPEAESVAFFRICLSLIVKGGKEIEACQLFKLINRHSAILHVFIAVHTFYRLADGF